MPPANPSAEEWFEAIDCDDEEFVRSMAKANPALLDEVFIDPEYQEDVASLAQELLGKTVGPLNPIQYAAFVESEDTAVALLDFYSDEKLTQKWGLQNTLFHLAAFNGLEILLKKLLKRKLPFTQRNKLNFRPVDCVANDATIDVFANYDVEDEPHDGVKESKKKMVDKTEPPKMNESVADADFDNDSEYEIAEYPPLRKIDPKAQPLPSALKKGSKKKKPTVQFESEPFFFDCCRNGEIDHVKRLIKDKIMSSNQKTFLGITALHMAVESGSLELVEFLVKEGAKIDAADTDGYTPLHLACSLNWEKIAEYLIKQGANVNLPTKEGDYTIELTESESLEKMIKALPQFDKSIIQIVAQKPPKEEEEDPKGKQRKGGD